MGKVIDLTGQKFGRLTVLERAEDYVWRNKRFVRWSCKCDCGNFVIVTRAHLKDGHAKSCGCLKGESARERSTKHGLYDSRLYNIWDGMKQRCCNPNSAGYSGYGGRGIKLCDEWRDDFSLFYCWAVNNGYREDLTIDRINNNGDYEPNNCRWITNKEQQFNKRNNRFITYRGETRTATEWAVMIGVKTNTFLGRLDRGWSIEKTMETPTQIQYSRK